MATIDGRWEPGIGDPTVAGWLTVVAYGLATWACWRACAARGPHARPLAAQAPTRFWLVLTISMALLGVNKQLDLQSALTQFGRDIAVYDGWWEQRRAVQAAFIAALAIVGVLAVGLVGWLSWPLTRGRALALGGMGFLLVFVMTRASSFHHVDILLKETAFGLRWNWILELSGIAMVAAGAALEQRTTAPAPARPSKPAPAKAATAPRPAPPPRAMPRADERGVVSPGDPRNKAVDPRHPDPPPVTEAGTRRRAAARGDDGPVLSPGDPRSKPGT